MLRIQETIICHYLERLLTYQVNSWQRKVCRQWQSNHPRPKLVHLLQQLQRASQYSLVRTQVHTLLRLLYLPNSTCKKQSKQHCFVIKYPFEKMDVPGSFFGFLRGTNFAPIANAIGGPNMNPRASIAEKNSSSIFHRPRYSSRRLPYNI